MDPNVWGPKAWFFLHTITFNYPENPTEKDKIIYSSFFNSLTNVLPCSICANHYKENLKKYPIETNLDNKDDLVNWLINLHNLVNEYNKKPTLSYNEVIDYYKMKYNISNKIKRDNNDNYTYKIVCIILSVLVIIQFLCIFYLYKCR